MLDDEQTTIEEQTSPTEPTEPTDPEPTPEPTPEDPLVVAARGWLRISTKARDEEIRQVVDACLIDLSNAGVVMRDTDDAAIRQCMKLYLKSQFGYDSNAEKFGEAYEHLKKGLSLSGDYNTEAEDGETD